MSSQRLLIDDPDLATVRSSPGYDDAYTADPLISVCIHTYNRAQLLCERSLSSVIRQTYGNWEAIVVGDGCTDDTATRIAALGDPRIRFVNRSINGPYPKDPQARSLAAGTYAANEAVALARGRWIAINNDDDDWTDDHLAVLVAEAQRTRAEFVYGRMRVAIHGTGEESSFGDWPPRIGEFAFQAAMFHAGLHDFRVDIEAYQRGLPGDWDLANRMFEAGVRATFLPRIVGTYHLAANHLNEEWWSKRARREAGTDRSAPADRETRDELERVRAAYDSALAEIGTAKDELVRVRATYDAAIDDRAATQEELNAVRHQVRLAETDAADVRGELERTRVTYQAAIDDRDAAAAAEALAFEEVQRLEKQNELLGSEIARVTEAYDAAIAQRGTAISERERAVAYVRIAAEERDAFARRVTSLEAALDNTEESLAIVRSSFDRLDDQLKARIAEIDALTAAQDLAELERARLSADLSDALMEAARIGVLRQRYRELEAELVRRNIQLAEAMLLAARTKNRLGVVAGTYERGVGEPGDSVDDAAMTMADLEAAFDARSVRLAEAAMVIDDARRGLARAAVGFDVSGGDADAAMPRSMDELEVELEARSVRLAEVTLQTAHIKAQLAAIAEAYERIGHEVSPPLAPGLIVPDAIAALRPFARKVRRRLTVRRAVGAAAALACAGLLAKTMSRRGR